MATILEALLLRFKPVVSKRVGVALGLWGEAGIGKTFSVKQILSQIQCKSLSLHSTVSLVQLVQDLPQSKRLEVWAESTLNRLSRGEHIPVESAADALAALLTKVAPVVLHLEDLHEVSAERLELIQQLARRVQRSKGVALLLTSRGELPEPIQGMRLEALSPQASKSLLETQLGAALPQEACDWIFARASGNALFTLEYFRHLTRMGHIWSDGQRWHWRVPQSLAIPLTVEALIEQVLENIPSELHEAVGAKTMLSRGSSPQLWAIMAGVSQEELEQTKTELTRQGVLSNEEFVHPLFKEVAVQKLTPVQRRTFARRAIDFLQNDPVVAAAFAEEAELGPEKTLALLLEAAQVSKSIHNPLQAARWLAQATHHAQGEERGKLALEAALTFEQHDLPKATSLAKLAVDHLGDRAIAAKLYARLLALEARLPEAIEALHTLIPTASLEEEINLYHQASDFVGLLERWHSRPELHQATPSTLASVAWAIAQQGDRSASEVLISRALEHPDLSEETRISLLVSRASNAFIGSELASACAVYTQIVEQARTLNKPRLLAQNLRNMALCRIGSVEQNILYLEEALDLYAQIGDGFAYAATQDTLGELLWGIGRYEQAEPLLLSSRAYQSQRPPSLYLVDCEYHLSKLYQDWQPPYAGVLALKHAHAALGYSRQLDNPRKIVFSLYYTSMAEARGGSPRQALVLADEALALSGELTVPVLACIALAARGHALSALGEEQQALAVFQEAYRKTSDLGIKVEAQKIGLEIDRITGDLESAQKRLEWFRDQRLLGIIKAAQSYFPQLEGEAGGGPDLSRAEGKQEAGSEENNKSISRHPILEVLGPIQIRQNDQAQPVRGQKRQVLLALLFEARLGGRSEVSRLDLVEALYPEDAEPKAMDALKQLVSALRELLGERTILTTSGGYALGEVDSDAEGFLQGGSTELWRGEYMQGLGLDSDNSADLLYLALKARITEQVSTNPSEAARLGRILLEGLPYDLSSLQLCLQALRATGNYKTLSRLYEGARARLREVGEVLPEKWAEFVA